VQSEGQPSGHGRTIGKDRPVRRTWQRRRPSRERRRERGGACRGRDRRQRAFRGFDAV